VFTISFSWTLLSLTQVERDEEIMEAKHRGISEIQTALPIGVTPVIMARYEKKMKDLHQTGSINSKTSFVPVWNREKKSTAKVIPSLNSLSLPSLSPVSVSCHSDNSQQSQEMVTPRENLLFHTPERTPSSARSRESADSSYDLDSSREDAMIELDTPQSFMSH
jgi:hypothetical protein